MKNLLLLSFAISTYSYAIAQTWDYHKLYKQIYPISENANINWKSSTMVNSETILFEANPNVRFSISNNIAHRFMGTNENKYRGHAIYLAYNPQLRMYTDNSVPVKMPSYRILLGYQQIFRIHCKKNYNFLSYSIESGHYSNGQSGSTFSRIFPDASTGSNHIIDSLNANPKANLSNVLNRVDGEFATDLTEAIICYRINDKIDGENIPSRTYALKLGATLFHDKFLFLLPFGGYSDNLIKIYGYLRYKAGIERTWVFNKNRKYICYFKNKKEFDENINDNVKTYNYDRLTTSLNFEYIQGAHQFVNPCRLVGTVSYFLPNDFGFFVSGIYGHDDYNIRFVDSGWQLSIGCAWNAFPSFKMK